LPERSYEEEDTCMSYEEEEREMMLFIGTQFSNLLGRVKKKKRL